MDVFGFHYRGMKGYLWLPTEVPSRKEQEMKVKIEPREECLGDGICADECPEVFSMDDDGLAMVINEEPGEDLREAVQNACDECPAEIIQIED